MWIDEILNDIEKTRFSLHKLFKNPITNELITRDQYIIIVRDDFLKKQKYKIELLSGLNKLEILENNLGVLTVLDPLECNKELTKALLTYIYWKYKNPKIKLEKVDMYDAKKVLGLDNTSIEKLINPIEFNIKCYICNHEAVVSIPSYEHNRIKFKCNNCGHTYETASSNNSEVNNHIGTAYVDCSCNLCNSIRNSFFDKGNTWFNNLQDICNQLIKNAPETTDIPSNLIMKRHYDIFINNKNDDNIKEILNYTPKTLDDLLEIVENISNLQDNCYEYYKLLISKLKKYNLIYTVHKKLNIDLQTLVLSYIFGGIDRFSDVTFDEFLGYIAIGKFIESYSITKHRHHGDYIILDDGFSFRACVNFNIVDEINVNNVEKYLYEEHLIINPYFFNTDDIRVNMINEINVILNDCSELQLKLILENVKTAKRILNLS